MADFLKVTKHEIQVSTNSLIEGGLYFDLQAWGILPKCRKVAQLSFSVSYLSIWFRNLWSYNGEAKISPDDMEKLIMASKVVSSSHAPVEITDEIRRKAYDYLLQLWVNSPAVRSTKDVAPGYMPKYNELVVE